MIFEPAEEGGYVVTCPALSGLVTEGDTLDEARAMAQDAIRGYLKSLAEDGEETPVENVDETVADLTGVDLTDVAGLTPQQLETAIVDETPRPR